MKRTLKPTGSRYFSAPKRVKQAAPLPYRPVVKKFGSTQGSAYSRFQRTSGIEKKNIDDSSGKWTTGVGTWTISVLNDVAQGTSATTRIGRKILMKSLLVQGYLTNTFGVGRILIIYDKQANGNVPIATDVLTSNTIAAVMNLDNRDCFIVVADIYPFSEEENLANPGLAGSPTHYSRFIKMNLETIYSGNAGTIADITSGSLIMMTNCGGGTVAGETGIQRIRFVDE